MLSDQFIASHDKMPWKDIKDMRDWVVHGYHSIDIDMVYKTATEDIKPLCEYCESIIAENK